MPPKSPVWDLFHSNQTKYKTNSTHLNAWCKACVAVEMCQTDAMSECDPPLTDQEKFDKALCRVEPICGKHQRLEVHVEKCKVLTPQECAKLIAWNTANNPEVQKFAKKWCHSNVKMLDWRVLSGRVLDGEVKNIEKTVKDAVAGLLVTGQCDGWKNIAKDHPYLVRIHNMTREPK
ncbi:hypothetical protein B0H34DRAFT_676900 [Crassisporium funariophilum]|nr:hypothetical protein B0H34DRAFT_676900 [Crassisporium funariophilum]